MSLDINQFTEIANNFMKRTLALETEDDVSNGLRGLLFQATYK